MAELDPDFELTDEMASFISDLHDSEINGEISWFYDGVWGVKIGDRLNGYHAEATFISMPQALRWLRDKALELYPDSAFAKDYRRSHPDYEPRPEIGRTMAGYRGSALGRRSAAAQGRRSATRPAPRMVAAKISNGWTRRSRR